jgi:hypothetical protein
VTRWTNIGLTFEQVRHGSGMPKSAASHTPPRFWGRGGHTGVSAEMGEVIPDAGVATGVASGADLLPQHRRVGAAGDPPTSRVGLIVVQDARLAGGRER